jgi:hypothetical protein
MQRSVSTVVPASILITGPATQTVAMHLNTHRAGRLPLNASLIQTRTRTRTRTHISRSLCLTDRSLGINNTRISVRQF